MHQERNALDNIYWARGGHTLESVDCTGLITMTDGHDPLRFFVVGTLKECNLLIRGGATLMSCIDKLLAEKRTDADVGWVIIAS